MPQPAVGTDTNLTLQGLRARSKRYRRDLLRLP
jgi:hypothetical protein